MRTASTVAVVGGGLTGIETATELAETYPDRTVRLVTSGTLGVALSERGRQHLHQTFDRLGIQVREHAKVAKVAADGLLLEGGEHIDADVVAWTTGFRVPPLAREAGLAVGDNGRMLVDGTMRSVSHPEVYGIGDAAAARKRGRAGAAHGLRARGADRRGRRPRDRRPPGRPHPQAAARRGRRPVHQPRPEGRPPPVRSTATATRRGRSSPAAWPRWSRRPSSAGPCSASATPPSPTSPPAARWPEVGCQGCPGAAGRPERQGPPHRTRVTWLAATHGGERSASR